MTRFHEVLYMAKLKEPWAEQKRTYKNVLIKLRVYEPGLQTAGHIGKGSRVYWKRCLVNKSAKV